MVTLADVAAKANVTVTTVSRMLNNKGNVSAKTQKRIADAMNELGYRPNELARSLSKKTSNFIGLIVPSAKNFFFSKIIDAVEQCAFKNGYKLLLCTSNHEAQKEIEYCRMLRANRVAGIIVASRTEHIWEQMEFDAPVIAVERVISPLIPAVCSDNLTGGILAARHLLEKGCKKPVYFSGSAALNMDANKRFLGFQAELNKAGIEPVFEDISEERFISMRYDEVIADVFERHPDADGAFTSNDIIAAQVIRFAGKRHIAVPDQLKVIGYDDVDMTLYYNPSITTIHQPIDDICEFAVSGIAGFHQGKTIPISTVFPVRLIERESTQATAESIPRMLSDAFAPS